MTLHLIKQNNGVGCDASLPDPIRLGGDRAKNARVRVAKDVREGLVRELNVEGHHRRAGQVAARAATTQFGPLGASTATRSPLVTPAFMRPDAMWSIRLARSA